MNVTVQDFRKTDMKTIKKKPTPLEHKIDSQVPISEEQSMQG